VEHEIQSLLTDLRSGVISRDEFVRKCLAAGATLSAIGMLLHNSNAARAAGAARPAGARKGGTLRVAIQGPSTGLDPAIISDPATIEITHNIYNFLVRVDARFTPYPDLATKWTTSKDGKTWTFPLHRNVKFHSGKACTADDVLYTFQRIRDPETGSAAASLLSGVTDIRKLVTIRCNSVSRLPILISPSPFPITISASSRRDSLGTSVRIPPAPVPGS